MAKKRCVWADSSDLMMTYHDEEWGVPVHEDWKLFEFLTLEGAQAGLSWQTVLRKRESYRKAFHNFDPVRVSKFTREDMEKLLGNPGIIRNRSKIEATIRNARVVLTITEEFGSFDTYIWRFVGSKSIQNRWLSLEEIPSRTEESDEMARDLKERGFKFIGTTICYAFMQAVGLVNDHVTSCFRYEALNNDAGAREGKEWDD